MDGPVKEVRLRAKRRAHTYNGYLVPSIRIHDRRIEPERSLEESWDRQDAQGRQFASSSVRPSGLIIPPSVRWIPSPVYQVRGADFLSASSQLFRPVSRCARLRIFASEGNTTTSRCQAVAASGEHLTPGHGRHAW
jgi:hypothetical protein